MKKSEEVQMMHVQDISLEDGSQSLVKSRDMEPYLAHIKSTLTGRSSDAAKKAVSELPLEKRYVWRIASSLRDAFCDFDRCSVRADLSTLNADQFDEVASLIDRRVVQFAMLLRTVFGSEQMEGMLLEAVDIAKKY